MALSLAVVVNSLVAGRLDLLPFALLPMVALAWLTLRGGLLLPALALGAMALLAAGLHAGASRPMPELVATLGLHSLWACLAAAQALVLLVHVFAGRSDSAARRYELALESADIGVAEWPLGAGTAYTSPRWRSLLGDPDGSRTSSLEGWLARVHGDDRGDLRQAPSKRSMRPSTARCGGRRASASATPGRGSSCASRWSSATPVSARCAWWPRCPTCRSSAAPRSARTPVEQPVPEPARRPADRRRRAAHARRQPDLQPHHRHPARRAAGHRADAAAAPRRPTPIARQQQSADLGRPAQPRPLERRGGGAPAQRRSVRAARERVHRARPRRRGALPRADGVRHHRAAPAARAARAPGALRRTHAACPTARA